MPVVQMCPVCRGSKVKCLPVDRIWIPGGQQDKCERCTQFNHDCGPHEYPPPRSRASRGSRSRDSQASNENFSPAGTTPASVLQQIEPPNEVQRDKHELKRRLRSLEMQVEATTKLQTALDYSIPGGQRNEIINAGLFSSRNANVRILILMPAQAEVLADRLAGCGETEAAEAAYSRVLDAYRALRKFDIKLFHETTSVLKKFADMLRSSGELIRAENLIWEALTLRDVPEKALPSDLELLKTLATSLPKTRGDISESIQSTIAGFDPPHLAAPFPPLQCMMQSSYAFTVADSPFHRGQFPDTSLPQNEQAILGGMDTIMDLLRALPTEVLDARDIYGQSPLYMASSLRMEGLARGILHRLAEARCKCSQNQIRNPSCRCTQHYLNSRDFLGQTVLGISILGGCSLPYLKFLIEAGAQVDPDTLRQYPWTPLQAAVISGSCDVARLLLDNGAGIDRVFRNNPTPLSLAEQAGHTDLVRLLSNTGDHSSPEFSLAWSPG